MTDDDRNQTLRRLFDEAVDLEAEPQQAFLARVSDEQPDLATELGEMLAFVAVEQDDQMARAFAATISTMRAEAPRIDGYEDLELVGEGGMGSVFRARQVHPVRRTVAIKTIRPGVATGSVLSRFEAERQALARMTHPGIATVHDAGCDAHGQPFLVMEYVDGLPIVEHCEATDCDLESRLQLFARVCDAVEHAHRRGVLHRDIKPSNILVSSHGDDAQPKVIDFGIAKAMEEPFGESGDMTMQGTLLGTLDYMSPEQLGGDGRKVDTRSDVYALGVILYEMLVGVRPLESGAADGLTDWLRIVREHEPMRPSRRILARRATGIVTTTSLRRMRRELDWVVMKALAKAPDRRYQSPRELADDVRRFLEHLPVEAGPPSEVYRLRKFVRRHRSWFFGIAAVFAILCAALVVTLRQAEDNRLLALEEQHARTRAQEAGARLRQNLYRSEMRYGIGEIDASDGLNTTRALVANWIPADGEQDLRGFEWDLLSAACNQHVHTAPGIGGIWWLDTDDDDRLVSTHMHGVGVWRSSDGRRLDWTPVGHETFGAIARSADGSTLVRALTKETLQVVDLATGAERRRLQHQAHVLNGRLSRDGRVLASLVLHHGLVVWDTETGRRLTTIADVGSADYAVSPDGAMIAVSLIQARLGVDVYRTGEREPFLHRPATWRVGSRLTFDDRSSRLASYSYDGKVDVWSLPDGTERFHASRQDEFGCGAFAPDGRRLAVGAGSSAVFVYDLSDGSVERLRGHDAPVGGVAWLADGERLVSMSEDQVLRWWRPGQRRTRHARQLVDTDELLDPQLWFDAAGDRLQLTAGRGQVSSWNLVDATVRRGKTLGVTDARLLRWSDADLADRLPPYRYAAISPDTGMLALADLEEGALWLWPEQAEGPQRIDGPNHLHNPEWMHGNRLVLLHGLNEVYVVDGDTGEPREKFAMGCDVGHAIPHPADELIVLCGSDRHVHLWVPGESDTRILQGHSAPVLAAAFSPDGRRLATGGSDRTVRLWDTSQWAEVAKLTTEAEVGELCWSADGTRLAAAMTSGAAIVWDTRGSTRER